PGTATYTITPSGAACSTPVVVAITVNPTPIMTATPVASTICTGTAATINLTSTVPGTTYTWTTAVTGGVTGQSNGSTTSSSISQTLSLPAASANGTVTYTITPSIGGVCPGTPIVVVINVNNTY